MSSSSNRQLEEQRHEEELAEAIVQYLAEHPQAVDTVKGIAEWWLMRQQVRVEVNTLVKVLRRLTERGLLEESGTGEYTRYRLKTERH